MSGPCTLCIMHIPVPSLEYIKESVMLLDRYHVRVAIVDTHGHHYTRVAHVIAGSRSGAMRKARNAMRMRGFAVRKVRTVNWEVV